MEMKMKQADVLRCLETLRKALSISRASRERPGNAFDGLVTAEFDRTSLDWFFGDVADPRFSGSVGESMVLHIPNIDNGFLFEARFCRGGVAGWLLMSLRGACPVCFAGAVDDQSTCTFCDGTGFDA